MTKANYERIVSLYVGPPMMSMEDVADATGYARDTVSRVLREAGVSRRGGGIPGKPQSNRARDNAVPRPSRVQEGRIVRPRVARYYR
jgi:hypothetical protein